MAIFPRRPGGGGPPVRRPRPKPKPRPRPRPVVTSNWPGGRQPQPPKPAPGGTTPAPAPGTTTTTTTESTGLPQDAAGQLAQDAGQLEAESQAANAFESQQPMVTTPTTTAPANAYQDRAADAADARLQSFFGTGQGYATHYHPGQTYAHEVAASSGAENNPT